MKAKRAISALSVVMVLTVGLAAVGSYRPTLEQQGAEVVVAGARARAEKPPAKPHEAAERRDRDHRTTTTTRPRPNQPPNSTAPEPPPSSTSAPTTAPPTTAPPTPTTTPTTAPPSTTTTQPQPLVTGDRWTVLLRGGDESGPDRLWWAANYQRALSYGLNTGWTDGDRAGYRCLYGFLTLDGVPVGRVTFMRVEAAASYASINDEKMNEGVRYYDGSLAPPGASKELGECPRPSLDYQPYNGPDQRPTIHYATPSGQILEIRNYKATVALEGITFQQTEDTAGRITVVAYEWGNPVIVVYYESISPQVVMSSDM